MLGESYLQKVRGLFAKSVEITDFFDASVSKKKLYQHFSVIVNAQNVQF